MIRFTGFSLAETDAGTGANNLNAIRLLAASMVTLSHAWPLTGHVGEPLARLTGVLTFGALSVQIFFVISGFLVARSFDRGTSWVAFVRARALRIYPGLFVALLVTVLVAQWLAGALPHSAFFSHPSVHAYFINNLIFRTQYDLPGFFEHNAFKGSVNGSLWTLRFEVFMYAVVLLAGLLGLLRRPLGFSLGVAGLLGLLLLRPGVWADLLVGLPPEVPTLGLCFGVGMVCYVNRRHVYLHPGWMATGLLVTVAVWCVSPPSYQSAAWCMGYAGVLGYTVLTLGLHPSSLACPRLHWHNDYSYGVYIYSFPIQQLVYHFAPAIDPWTHAAMAYPIALLCAVASWHGVEKQALALKRA